MMSEILNLRSLIKYASDTYGEKTYLFSENNLFENITFDSLEKFTVRFNSYCENNHISIGEKIAIMLPNSPLFVLLLISTIATGRILIPINPKFGDIELSHVINLTKPKLIIHNKKAYDKLKNFQCDKKIIDSDKDFFKEINKLDNNPSYSHAHINNNDTAEIVFTSGSTGTPKGVVITQGNLIANILGISERLNPSMHDIFLTLTPLYHNSGQFFSTFVPLVSGSSCTIVKPELALANFWHYIEKYKINWTLTMPTHINFLLQQNKEITNGSLKGIVVGGAPLSVAAQKQFEKKFNVNILKTYGLTETCSFSTCDFPNKNQQALGASGKPLSTNMIKIVKSKKFIDEPFVTGEIWIKGSNVVQSYLDNKKETTKKFINGWLATGDLGYIDKEHNVYVIDRIDNMIIVNGENVYPSEIENLLSLLNGIKQGVVTSIPNEIMGNELVLIYEGLEFNTLLVNEWIAVLQKKIASYKIPMRYVNVTEFGLNTIPKSENGKILREKIKKLAHTYLIKEVQESN